MAAPGRGERGLDDVDQHEDGGEQGGVWRRADRKRPPVRLQAFQRQVLPQVEKWNARHDRREYEEDQDLPGFIPITSSPACTPSLQVEEEPQDLLVRSPNSFRSSTTGGLLEISASVG